MLDTYETALIRTAIKTPTTAALKQLVSSSNSSMQIEFCATLPIETRGTKRYLILLCPELNYDFLAGCEVADPTFRVTTLKTTLSSLVSDTINTAALAFVPASNLLLDPTRIPSFVDLVVGEQPTITRKTLGTKNGLFEIGCGEGKLDLSWFVSFGTTNPLLRSNLQARVDTPLTLLIAKDRLTCVVVDVAANKSNLVSSAEEIIYGPSTRTESPAPTSIERSALKLHLYGAFLIQTIQTITDDSDDHRRLA